MYIVFFDFSYILILSFLDDEEEKEVIYKEIIAATEQVKAIRKEIRFCNEIEKRVPVMKREIKELDERGRKEVENNKRKEREWER